MAGMQRDEYRVTLFKKNLREIMGTPWMRFYNSIDRSHLVIDQGVRREDFPAIIEDLRRAGIVHIVKRNPYGLYDDRPESEQPIWYISVPIDQEALPERKRNHGQMAC